MQTAAKMKRICAWCGAVMEDGDENLPVTHGICKTCADDLIARSARKLKEIQ